MSAPGEIARLPDGFLDRGADVTRLEAFVDAAFAFAVTLLVISLNSIPDSIPGMLDALKGIPSFAASFAQIMMFWSAHATWSRRFGLDDKGSGRLSLLLVFLVLVYVYPLKILFGSLFAWISGGWIPPVAQIHSLADLVGMFTMYGIAFGTLSLCMAALNRQALRAKVTPPLDEFERACTRREIVHWLYHAAVATASIAFAMLLPGDSPGWLFGMPGMLYVLLSFTGVVINRFAPHAVAHTPA
ncbi:MAG: TMEM175 family protein [Arenimonas sp.]